LNAGELHAQKLTYIRFSHALDRYYLKYKDRLYMSYFIRILILVSVTLTSALLAEISDNLASDSTLDRAAQAVQLRDRKTYFTQPPTLVDSETTVDAVYGWGATYYFHLSLPDNAGEPLQRVVIDQHEGGDKVTFDLQDSLAFATDRSGNRTQLNTAIAVSNTNPHAVTVDFDPPVPPGNKISIGLRPHSNPRFSGIYLFGVTAFPAGEQAHGQFLGYGRLHFYDRSDRSLFRR
jgi:hypothetical protein